MKKEEITTKLLLNLLDQLENEENEFHFKLKDIDLTDFIHSLSNMLPTIAYNRLTGEKKNNLEFNHIANRLCFQFSNK